MSKNAMSNMEKLEQRAFLLCLLLVTLAFFWVLGPFFSAIFWSALLTILLFPLRQRLLVRWPGRHTTVSLATLLVGIVLIIAPVLLFASTAVQEALGFYQRLESGEIDLRRQVDHLRRGMPWVQQLLDRLGISLTEVVDRLSGSAVAAGGLVARHAVNLGQNAFRFTLGLAVMLYLTFFLLRDGERLVELMVRALPLGDDRERQLFDKFAEVARATIKGNLVIALIQGALGALAFWVLGIDGALFWGLVMAIVSLIPAVGASLVWGPVALYLIVAADELWRGIILIVYGVGIIGMMDNLLRPVLVGRDTRLPDYLVLLSTLGGLTVFGINGFVIGPLVAALFVAFWNIFMLDFYGHSASLEESPEPVNDADRESGSSRPPPGE